MKTVEVAEEAYFAQNNAYTDIPGLVTAKLLKTAPSTDNDYTISVNSGTGDVIVDHRLRTPLTR